MRTRISSVVVAAVFVATALSAAPARGERILIHITGGSGEWTVSDRLGRIDISGADGFRAHSLLGGDPPAFGCCVRPGETLSLQTNWAGGDTFRQVVEFSGETYTDLNGAVGPSFITFDFEGSIVAPAFVPAATTVIAPFTFTGELLLRESEQGPTIVDAQLAGGGTATVFLTPNDGDWFAHGIAWSFDDASAAPVPEPGSMLLMGMGLAGAVRAYRRRRT